MSMDGTIIEGLANCLSEFSQFVKFGWDILMQTPVLYIGGIHVTIGGFALSIAVVTIVSTALLRGVRY